MSDSWTCHIAYTKLRFFGRIKRFLHLKSSNKRHEPSDHQSNKARVSDTKRDQETTLEKIEQKNIIGEEEYGVVLQGSVKRLHFGSWEEKEVAAGHIKRLAGEDLKLRKTMAELGVISPLVEMVGSDAVARRRLAVQTLVELANGTYTNKALIMETGILSKLPKNIGVIEKETRHGFAQLIMSISSIANSQFPINSSKIIPFVVTILESDSNCETKELCLGTLYNLSTMLDNASNLVTNEVINNLLKLSTIKETSEKALATLVNLVVTLTGKKALENNSMVPEILIDVMMQEEKPRNQELCAYILMNLAHQSPTQRLKMVNAGIVPVLLQVSLLSTPLAQKRALRLLQWLKEERPTKIPPHSGPQKRRLPIDSPINHGEVSQVKKLMKNMVKQSLYKNMESMARRANGDDSSSKLKWLVVSTSSKSLPY